MSSRSPSASHPSERKEEAGDRDVARERDYFDGSTDSGLEAANGSAGPAVPAEPGGQGGGRKDGLAPRPASVDEQLEALFEKYEVPQSDRPLRRRLTLEAVERIRADIPLFAREPRLKVGFGSWWLTLQDLANPRAKEILIPLEDIFVRAVDEQGVREAVGAAAHEVMHYSITRPDPDHPLTSKYALRQSPAANNLLYQHLEDARINSWGLQQVPGLRPYFDAAYEALWPEDPSAARALERGRVEALKRSTLRVPDAKGGERDWMPPHLQYVNSILYHWRHRKPPPYLSDPAAQAAFERTLPALERVRLTHPQALGGVVLEEAKRRASSQALETIDREIFPEYQRLIAESERQLDQLEPKKDDSRRKPGEPSRELLDALDERVREVVERHGRKGEGSAHDHDALPSGPEDAGPRVPAPVKDESWAERRARAVEQRRALEAGFTDYERYRRRAQQLGLITQVDGMVKKLLLPTKHARLSRQVYHEGDEPDMNKYYDDLAQGRVDAPMMRRWNRRIKRSAKIALVLDISGSMGNLTEAMDSKLDQALVAIVAWIEVCQQNGLDFELLLFDDKPDPVHRFGSSIDKAEKDRILQTIAGHSRGSTAIGAAFKAAVESLAKQPATHRFILFATDEDHNSGVVPEQYAELARRHRIATVAMVIGADEATYKHFDHRVSVKEAKDLPRELLGVLTRALRAMVGSAAGAYGVALSLAPKALELFSGFASMGFGDVAGEPRPAPAPGRPSVFSELRAYLEGVLGLSLPAAKEGTWRISLAKLLRQDPGKDLRAALVESLSSTYDLDPPVRRSVQDALAGKFVIQDTLARTIDSVSFAGGALYAVRQPFPKDEPRLYRFTGSGWRIVADAPQDVRQVIDYRGRAHAVADDGLWRLEEDGWRLAVRGGFSSAYAAGDELFVGTYQGLYRVRNGAARLVLSGIPVYEVRRNADGEVYAATTDGLYVMRESIGSVWSAPLRWLGLKALQLLLSWRGHGLVGWEPVLRDYETVVGFDEWDRPYAKARRLSSVQHSLVADGELWAQREKRLERRGQDGRWVADSPPGEVQGLVELDGAAYAVSEYGVFRRTDGAWKRVLDVLAGFKVVAGQGLLVFGGPGVRLWPARQGRVLEDLEDRLLEELGPALRADPTPKTSRSTDHDLDDASGRSLF